jgi:hypothetical protein
MVFLIPPGKCIRGFLLMPLCLLVLISAAMAQSQKRVNGGSLHVVGTPSASAKQTSENQLSSSNCLSIDAAAQLQMTGQLTAYAQSHPCQAGSKSSASSQSTESNAGSKQAATIAPWLADTNSSSSTVNTAGFSGFLVPPSYPTLSTPVSNVPTLVTLSADFLNHGYKDILTIDSSAQVHLLANQGDGSFARPVTSNVMPSGSYYTSYQSAIAYDYDKDGYPDVVARNGSQYTIAFFHNNHDGTFTLDKDIQLPSCYYAAAFLIGDVNKDGTPDLTTFVTSYSYSTSSTTLNILVYLGDGTGYFQTTPVETDFIFPGAKVMVPSNGALLSTNAGRASLYMDVHSLNSYGINGSTVFALGLNGDGTFLETPYTQQDFPSANIYVNPNTSGMSLVDLNKDGIPDITMSFMDGYIYTALGASDGSFPTVQSALSAHMVTPQQWAIRDIDGDGIPDFVVKDTNVVEVLPGLGTGQFRKAKTYYTVASSNSQAYENSPGFNMVLDDFDRDGVLDMIYVDGSYNGYSRAIFLQGHGDGSFQASVALPAYAQLGYDPGYLHGQAVLDTNGDGRADIFLQDIYGSGPYPFRTALSDGKGGFTIVKATVGSHGKYTLGPLLATGDFNHDGLKDLVMDAYWTASSSGYNHTLAILLSKGDGTFAEPTIVDLNGTALEYSLKSVALGDINGDGTLDIVGVTTGGYYDAAAIITVLGNSDGTFQTATTQPFGTAYTYAGVALADFNNDSKLDLFISDDGDSDTTLPSSSIIFGDNSGTFSTSKAVAVTSGLNIRKALVGDLNGDGKLDLTFLSAGMQSGSTVTTTNRGMIVYLNNGDGTFSVGNTYETGTIGGNGLLADVNSDGKLDVIFTADYPWNLATTANAGAQLLLGHGDGTFGAPTNLMLPPSISMIASGDLNGQGVQDLVTYSAYVGTLAVVRNLSGSTLALTADESTIAQGASVTFTAVVQPAIAHRPTPTGNVKFLYNGQTLGVALLNAGSASFSVSSLPVGSDSVTAVYEGDTNYSSTSNGATVAVTVASAPVVASDFTLNAPSSTLTIAQGSNASLSFSLSANASFTGTVSFTAKNLPSGMSVSFVPSSVTLAPGATATETLFVSTATNTSSSNVVAAGVLTVPLLGSLFCLVGGRRRLKRQAWIVIVLLGSLAGLVSFSGCGSSSVRTASAGDYTISVQATPSVSGVTTKAFNVTVHVD